ncbi:MAG: hypothetical protein HRT35_07275, partial [Algicola sp.]|nr:hypothetical protein [Algicola sp.]
YAMRQHITAQVQECGIDITVKVVDTTFFDDYSAALQVHFTLGDDKTELRTSGEDEIAVAQTIIRTFEGLTRFENECADCADLELSRFFYNKSVDASFGIDGHFDICHVTNNCDLRHSSVYGVKDFEFRFAHTSAVNPIVYLPYVLKRAGLPFGEYNLVIGGGVGSERVDYSKAGVLGEKNEIYTSHPDFMSDESISIRDMPPIKFDDDIPF